MYLVWFVKFNVPRFKLDCKDNGQICAWVNQMFSCVLNRWSEKKHSILDVKQLVNWLWNAYYTTDLYLHDTHFRSQSSCMNKTHHSRGECTVPEFEMCILSLKKCDYWDLTMTRFTYPYKIVCYVNEGSWLATLFASVRISSLVRNPYSLYKHNCTGEICKIRELGNYLVTQISM